MGKIKAQEYRHAESRYIIFLYPEKQKVSIKCPGFVEAEFPMFSELKPRQQFTYEINEAFDTKGKGDFTLQSDPSGADITIDQFPGFKEKTPFVFKGYGAMTYTIRLQKPRYEQLSANILIEPDKAKSQTIKLVPKWADLTISSEPTGSTVYINNAMKGSTPLSLTGVTNGLDPGSYNLEIRTPSKFYESYSQKLSLNANSKEEIEHKHKDISGIIQITPSHQPIQLYLNNQTDTELTEKLSKRLIAGTYSLKAFYAGEHRSAFDPVEKSIQLQAGDRVNLPFAFQPRMHSLNLSANVPDYTLHILDQETGKTSVYSDSGQIPPLYAGAYTIRVVKPGYRIVEQELNLVDKDLSLEFSLMELDKIYRNRVRGWKVSKYISATTLIISLGATAYFGYNSLQNYDNYQKATTSSAAADYRSKAIDSRNIAYPAMGIDVLGGSWMLYSYLKQRQWQKKLQNEMGRP
jgi:hypothetical protein